QPQPPAVVLRQSPDDSVGAAPHPIGFKLQRRGKIPPPDRGRLPGESCLPPSPLLLRAQRMHHGRVVARARHAAAASAALGTPRASARILAVPHGGAIASTGAASAPAAATALTISWTVPSPPHATKASKPAAMPSAAILAPPSLIVVSAISTCQPRPRRPRDNASTSLRRERRRRPAAGLKMIRACRIGSYAAAAARACSLCSAKE